MKKKNLILIFIFIYLVTIMFMVNSALKTKISGDRFSAMCLGSSFPSVDFEETKFDDNSQSKAEKGKIKEEDQVTATVKEETLTKVASGKPLVLIYHTHATESYLPVSKGNYHTLSETASVRDAGNVLKQILESKGIGVIHDKTLHDNPSYSDSYYRSYDTVETILKNNPSIVCIIDLHRDAIPGTKGGPVMNVKGKTCAKYSYVIGSTAKNCNSNRDFVNKLNQIGGSRFDGYTGEVLERPYQYNQQLGKTSILLEMGNNRNNIEDVRRGAKVFGEILAKALL